MLKETKQQIEQQQEMVNTIYRQVTENDPAVQFKSANILDTFDFDIEK